MTDAPTQPAHDPFRVLTFRAPYDAAVTFDATFRYTAVTPEAADALGTTVDALLGRCCWDVFPECEGTPIGSLMRVVMATRTPGEIRSPVHHHADRDVIARAVPTPDGGIRVLFRFVTRVVLPARPASFDHMTGTR